jgi:hypothetical protein
MPEIIYRRWDKWIKPLGAFTRTRNLSGQVPQPTGIAHAQKATDTSDLHRESNWRSRWLGRVHWFVLGGRLVAFTDLALNVADILRH